MNSIMMAAFFDEMQKIAGPPPIADAVRRAAGLAPLAGVKRPASGLAQNVRDAIGKAFTPGGKYVSPTAMRAAAAKGMPVGATPLAGVGPRWAPRGLSPTQAVGPSIRL